jgi:hypothetical protein
MLKKDLGGVKHLKRTKNLSGRDLCSFYDKSFAKASKNVIDYFKKYYAENLSDP